MSNGKSIAVIPARRGSKRLPGKNMRLLGGKPLIQWTIEAALASTAIDEVIVSSDDKLLLELALSMGVSHIVERPGYLASDTATTVDVLVHAIEEVVGSDSSYETICLLQATSPLRTVVDIDAAFELYYASDKRSIISVCELEHPLAWCNALSAEGGMKGFAEAINQSKRSQDYQVFHRLNGAIYIARLKDYFMTSGFLNETSLAYVMPKHRSIDIDDVFDFRVAEALLN